MSLSKKTTAAAVVPFVAFVLAGGLMASISKFKFVHPRNARLAFAIDRETGTPVLSRGEPVATVRVTETEFDFGVLDPHQTVVHRFLVKNVGEAPLALRVKETTCKCTVATATQGPVAPGGETFVDLEFNTGRVESYHQTATILTNDPRVPELQLSVRGVVRVQVAIEPRYVMFDRLDPAATERAEQTVAVYSQLESFELLSVTSDIEGIEWDQSEVAPQWLEEKGATFGRLLTVKAPAAPEKGFSGRILVKVRFAEREEEVEVPVVGKTLRRLSIYGEAIDTSGKIDLGKSVSGKPASATLLMKVRDPQLELPDLQIEATPECIAVDCRPLEKQAGMYVLKLSVQAAAPPGFYEGIDAGRLSIRTSHPRIEPLSLPVEFMVTR